MALPPPPPPAPPKGLLGKLKSRRVWIPVVCVLAFILVVLGAWWIFDSLLAALVSGLTVALVVLLVVLLRVVFSQDREDRVERGIHDPQQALRQQQAYAASAQATDIDGAFRRAITELQSSRLGRDVYALPWFLVVGETGAGKSKALQASGLDLPPEYAHIRPSGPTRDCNFWFTNQSILLDTAGRLVESEDPAATSDWRRLLQLLRQNRPGTALDGLIVALPIDALLTRSSEENAERAHTLRRRINELTDSLRVDVPIYVLVTKSDLLEGFLETVYALPPERQREAFGWTNDRRHFADAGELAQEAFDEIGDQLEALLPEMLMREPDPIRRRRLFLFPQELSAATRRLAEFLRAAFAPSVYGEVPFLRGAYFSSAKREGITVSPVLQRLGQEWARSRVDGESHGERPLFLFDFFREIALGDQDLALPANWMGRRFRRVATYVTAAIALVAMALLGIAFVDNLGAERRLATEARLVVDGASSLASLDRLRVAIEETGGVDGSRQRLPLHGVGLGGNLDRAGERARTTFNWAFGREYESPTKKRLTASVRAHEAESFEALASLALDVSWLASRGASESGVRPTLLPYAPVGRNEADQAAFVAGYDAFVRWIEEPELRTRVEDERDLVNAAAPRLLDLRRLEQWAERTRPPVRYADFGLTPSVASKLDEVHPAYTEEVWESLVRDLVAGVETTGGISSDAIQKFRQSYVRNFDRNWRDFLLGTPTKPVPRSRVKDSPYITLLARIEQETGADLPRDDPPPSWVATLREVRRTEPLSEEEPLAPWQRYEVEIDQVEVEAGTAAEQGDQALELARILRDPEGTSFGTALAFIRDLVRGDRDTQAAFKLRQVLSMPVLDGGAAVLESALDELDRRWRDDIVGPFSGTLDSQQLEALYQPNGGELAKFLEAGAGPFYRDGESVPVLAEHGLAFGPGLLAWMQHAEGMQRSLYPGQGDAPRISVRLEGIPSRTVGGSAIFVSRRDLRLTCADDADTFAYREGSGHHTFAWTPHCQEVSLRVWARSQGAERELQPRADKSWRGPLAFPQMLQSAQRLPGNRLQWRLEYDDVELLVEYRLRAGAAILEIAHRTPPGSLRD